MKYKIGDKVYYHSILGEPHDGMVRTCISDPWQLGHGAWVIKVSGISGGVLLEALSPAQGENWTPGPFKWQDTVMVDGTSFNKGGFVGKRGTVICHFGNKDQHFQSEGDPPGKEDRALMEAADNLYWQLLEADQVICNLCKRLNPQHVNCASCGDRDERLRALANARGEQV